MIVAEGNVTSDQRVLATFPITAVSLDLFTA